MCTCTRVFSRRGAGSTLPVPSHVSQKGRKVFTANSLHSSVSEHSAHIRRLHARKHNLFDATLPTHQSLLPHWDSQCLTSISYSEQAGRQAVARREWTPSCCKSAFKHWAKCNLERVNKRPAHYAAQDLFVFILECAIDFCCSPNDVCKRWTEKSHTSFFADCWGSHLLISVVLMRTSGG